MTPTDLETIETALVSPSISEDDAVRVLEALGELRRRDWAVRVLDAARARLLGHAVAAANRAMRHDAGDARLRTAQAIFPDLPQDEQARLGECP